MPTQLISSEANASASRLLSRLKTSLPFIQSLESSTEEVIEARGAASRSTLRRMKSSRAFVKAWNASRPSTAKQFKGLRPL